MSITPIISIILIIILIIIIIITLLQSYISDQQIVIFPADKNRNRFTEPTFVQIEIGIVCVGIGIIFVRLELFGNYSQISEIYFISHIFCFIISFSWLLYIFSLKNLWGKENHNEIDAHPLYLFLIKIRYSWILWKIFVNRNIIRQITTLANRINIHEMKLWKIGIGIYLWPKYQRIDSWQIYLRTIRKLFTNRELFTEHYPTYIHTLIYSYIPIFLHSYIPKFLRSYIPTFLHSYIPTFLKSYIPILLYSYIPTFLHSWIPKLLNSYIPSFLNSHIPTFLNSYILLFLHSYNPTFLPSYIPTFLQSYIPPFLHPYIPSFPTFTLSYIHTFLHFYIHIFL